MQKDKNVIFTVKQEDVNAIGQLIVWNQVHRILGDGNLKGHQIIYCAIWT